METEDFCPGKDQAYIPCVTFFPLYVLYLKRKDTMSDADALFCDLSYQGPETQIITRTAQATQQDPVSKRKIKTGAGTTAYQHNVSSTDSKILNLTHSTKIFFKKEIIKTIKSLKFLTRIQELFSIFKIYLNYQKI